MPLSGNVQKTNEYLYVTNISEMTSIMFMKHVKPQYQVKYQNETF